MTASDGETTRLVHDEIAQVRFFLFADRSFERNGLLGDAQHLADFADRKLHLD